VRNDRIKDDDEQQHSKIRIRQQQDPEPPMGTDQAQEEGEQEIPGS
jgi:hypothetical protein